MDSCLSSSDEEVLALTCLLYATASNERKKKRVKRKQKRSVWVRQWISRRHLSGAYSALIAELEADDPKALKNFLRMDKTTFDNLLFLLTPVIQKKSTPMRDPIPAADKLAVTLRFLASGDSYGSLEFLYRIPRNTVCKFIPEVCQSIYDLLKEDYMKVPSTVEEWGQLQQEFLDRWQFPNCVGAIDGKHVALRAPDNSGSQYFNYKKFFSLVLLALVDANCKFIFVDVGANGRAGDASIYANSELAHALENNTLHLPPETPLPGGTDTVPALIVGDEAFPLKPYLMKPYPSRNLTNEKRVFNYRLSRARRVSENAFGILASRFCIYRKPLQVSPEVAIKVVLATTALHNFLKTEDTVYTNEIQEIQIQGIETQGGIDMVQMQFKLEIS